MTDQTMADAAAAFADLDAPPREPKEQQEQTAAESGDIEGENDIDNDVNTDEDAAQDGDEPSETDEQEEEPEAPAIDPPARWDADQKKLFATLSPEAQRTVAATFTEAERAIGRKAEEAAAARKQSEAAVQEFTNVHRQFAEQLDTYAQAIVPQRPSHELLATDPQAYAYHMAQYEAASAQLNELQQRSAQARQQAQIIEKQLEQREIAEEYARIVEVFPQWADETGRKALADKLAPVGRALGYDDTLMAQAGATDLKALDTAAEWKSKADKWDALQASKMANVRSAKTATKVSIPGTAQPKGQARAQGLQDSMKRLRSTGDVRDAAAAFARLG